jgi:hypothetical protein
MKAESAVTGNCFGTIIGLSPNIIYYGRADDLPRRIILSAGPLTAEFETGDLRYIRLGDREIIRRIYAAVRDRNWRTISGQISELTVNAGQDNFSINYCSTHEEGEIRFVWHASIDGKPDGTISFRFTGEAQSAFLSNRIGCCVLHPINLAGQSCQITHASGDSNQTSFPLLLAPAQPLNGFENIRTIHHIAGPQTSIEISFFGDRFETEDQRNWIDASFKTYCRPLSLPYPFQVRAGDRIDQSVTIRLVNDQQPALVKSVPRKRRPAEATLRLHEDTVPMPRLGLGCSLEQIDERLSSLLMRLTPDHLRVDLRLAHTGWRDLFQSALQQAVLLRAALEIAVFLGDNSEEELAELREVTRVLEPRIVRWLIFHEQEKTTSSRWLKLARDYLKVLDPNIPIASGTNADFYQLNQFRLSTDQCDAICWSANPQVHAFDNASMVETLEAHRAPIESARAYFPEKPLIISPVTLRPRFNPVATGEETEDAAQLPSSVDPRQMSLFCAGWTIGSINEFSAAGVDSLTYFETTGWKGLIESASGPLLPDLFFSFPYAAFPVYHILAEVLRFSGGAVQLYANDDALSITGIALKKEQCQMILVANLTGENRRVALEQLPGPVAWAKVLDATTFAAATSNPEWFQALGTERVDCSYGKASIEIAPFGIYHLYFGL